MVPTVREGHLARPEPWGYPPPTSARSLCSSISASSSCPKLERLVPVQCRRTDREHGD
jgi:hypothetical protein